MLAPKRRAAALLVGGILSCIAVSAADQPIQQAGPEVAARPEPIQPPGPQVRILAGPESAQADTPFLSFSCEIANPHEAVLKIVAYRPDSFEPPLEPGTLSPIYVIELQRTGEWEEHPLGWCGWGMDGVELPAASTGSFGFSLPANLEWDAVRVGVQWGPASIDYATAEAGAFTTAWSEPWELKDLNASGSASE